ncbi:MAG: ribonuclease E inhibitor RraB [Paracoccaceae bacterium]
MIGTLELRAFAAGLVLLGSSGNAMAQNLNRIERETLQEMFDRSLSRGDWRIDHTCLWGYFFADTDIAKLEAAATELMATGYNYVSIFDVEPEGGEERSYFLHVERVERHSVDSLHQRNAVLYDLADRYNLDSYDGMDVGPSSGGECAN